MSVNGAKNPGIIEDLQWHVCMYHIVTIDGYHQDGERWEWLPINLLPIAQMFYAVWGTNKVDETSPEMRCKSDDEFAKIYTDKSSFMYN